MQTFSPPSDLTGSGSGSNIQGFQPDAKDPPPSEDLSSRVCLRQYCGILRRLVNESLV